MKKLEKIMSDTDFELLREQKLGLLNVIHNRDALPLDRRIVPIDCLAGIIHLIDAIQDAVVEDGIKAEEEVFGKPECEHNIVSAVNKVVKSGYVCTECGDIFTTADGKEEEKSNETEGLKAKLAAHERAITVLQEDMTSVTYGYAARVEMQLIILKIQAAHRDIATELADKKFDEDGK